MKKNIFSLIAVLVLGAACTQLEDEVSRPSAPGVKAPTITVSAVADDCFKVNVTAAEGTLFYSYAVVEKSQAVSADKVFKVKTGGVVEATVDFKEKKSVSFDVEELDFNTTYVVYAVAGNADGDLSDLASQEVLTTDNVDPDIDDFEYEENKCVIYFTEPVKFAGKPEDIVVNVYGVKTVGFAESEPLSTAKVEKVEVDGDACLLEIEEMHAGAYYGVNFPEGTFTDLVGNALPALESAVGFDEDGEVDYEGVVGHITNVDWTLDIFGGKPVELVKNMADAIWMSVPEEVKVEGWDADAVGSIYYENDFSKCEYKIFYGAPTFGFGWNGTYNCALTYPNFNPSKTGFPLPEPGDQVTITIPTFLFDAYGNVNEPFEIGPFLYSYHYAIEDVLGIYENAGVSSFGADYNEPEWTLTIEKSDDAEEGNVMITSYYGFDCKIYGDFDVDFGTAHFPIDFEPLGADVFNGMLFDYYTFAYNSTYEDGGEGVTFLMPKKGALVANDEVGYYFDVYSIPEGGIDDIGEEDSLGYDYNCFGVNFKLVVPSISSVKTMAARAPYMWGRPAGNFTRKK